MKKTKRGPFFMKHHAVVVYRSWGTTSSLLVPEFKKLVLAVPAFTHGSQV